MRFIIDEQYNRSVLIFALQTKGLSNYLFIYFTSELESLNLSNIYPIIYIFFLFDI